ncbi:hypothetical protein PU629_18000 [Pullulanibacillus sp. KACC 23026]|uniref:hypothetical protein n=1 Tax=Pullulanibacillus sp. KACC 23026 TaxID=3028315 RepID=UPI0023B0ACE5|nr:hypothetical protein [Pullulanibacillus sp. KACC 23026]WEG11997.1 hypothetical protein PU629_18000 [Pullulanibacillus sp. KACC 23026]
MARISLVSMAVGAGIGVAVARSLSKRQQSQQDQTGGAKGSGIEHLISKSLQEDNYDY